MGEVVDVLVIGAGPSGAVVAKRAAEAGLSVMCLEQGDWPDRSDYPGARPEAELLAAGPWSSSPQVRRRPGDYPIDRSGSDLGILNFNGVGGGTVLYNAQWPRMVPEVFADWPLDYEDLRPHYEATDRDFGVSGLGGNPAYPPGADPPLPPLPIGDLGLRVARAHARLGWHWWPATNAILSAPHAGRNPCVQRGTCGSGCNEGAKASADITHWPTFARLGGRVVTGATVRRILTDRRGLACGVEWVDRAGRAHHQPARVVVCAANAVGSARLLLVSELANSSGLVGRHLMLHPLVSVSGLFDGPPDGYRAHNGALIHCLEFARPDPTRGVAGGATWALGSAGGPLRHALAPDGRGRWGADHHAHVRSRLGRTASWVVIAEDPPDPANRVELSSTLTDAAGVPAPRLVYRLAPETERLLRWNAARAAESLREAGAWHVEENRLGANGHLLGTARMGTDPATSVVDPWCVSHDVPNLLVVDGSVFPTAGSANPTSTIVALAHRAAERLVRRWGELPRPALPTAVAVSDPPARPDGARPDPPVADRPPPAWPASGGAPASGGSVGAVSGPAAPDPPHPPRLDDGERAALDAVAEALIPGAARVGVADRLIDRVLAARPDLAAGVRDGLARSRELAAGAWATDPGLATLRYAVAAAYYLDEGVRAALDYHPQDVRPVRALDYPAYLEEGLLDHLVS
ncbi:MAG TPA: GMC oxidoreductase [Acidimicrobiales bacterium]